MSPPPELSEVHAAAPATDALRTDSRKVYILPTRFGVLFGGALLLMLLVSVNYNNGLGHLFTFLLAGVAVVAMHYTQRNLVGIRVSLEAGRPVFAGEQAHAAVRIRDELRRERRAVWLRGAGGEHVFDLAAGGEKRIELPFHPPRRGVVALPDTYLVSVYPMGLFCAWTRILRGTPRQLVYPRPAPPLPLPVTGGGDDAGDVSGGRSGQGDFDNLRDHRLGDPLSRVHWRTSARGTGLKTKVFGGEGRRNLVLRFADTAGDTETRLSILCRWVLDAQRANLEYALQLPGRQLESGRGLGHQQRCLELLALYKPVS